MSDRVDHPDGWASATIEDVATYVQRGKSPKYSERSDLPIVNQKCIRWHGIEPEFAKFVHEEQIPKWDQVRYLRLGDLLWNSTGTGTIGRACLYRGEFPRAVVDSHVTVVRANVSLIEPRYLKFFVMSPLVQANFAQMQTGSTNQVELSRAAVLATEISLAPLNEQRRIVEKIESLFAQLDKGEEALRKTQKLLASYRQSVLKAAVNGEMTCSSTGAWETLSLGELLTDIRYGTAKKCRPDTEGTAVLRIPNVVKGDVDLADLKFAELSQTEIEKLELEQGDILVVRSNGSAGLVGRGAVVGEEAIGMAFAGYLIRLRVNQTRLLPGFLQLVLDSPFIRQKIELQARSTSGVHNINSGELRALRFDLPPVETQKEILEQVDVRMERLGLLESWCETELARSSAVRQSILNNAFVGRLVPQDPNDESASELLARIKGGREQELSKSKQKRRKKAAAQPARSQN